MDIVEKMPDKWIKELTSCVSEKGLLFLDWYDAENLRDFIKAKDEEIERLRENFTHAATIAKTAWLTESCDTIGDAEYGSELCQIISDKISAIQQKEKE